MTRSKRMKFRLIYSFIIMNTYSNHLETLDMTVLQDSKEIGPENVHLKTLLNL